MAAITGTGIITEEGFKERVLAAKPVQDFESAITKVWEDYAYSWDGGESNNIAQRRGIQALEKVLERYEGQNIAIGTHGNIMALMMNDFDPSYDFAFWKRLAMPDIYKLSFEGQKFLKAARLWGSG